MRANTKLTIRQADVIINVPLGEFGSLDWRRSNELIAEGYKAAEAMRDHLLPLAVSADEYAKWQAARSARRRTHAAGARVRRASKASARATSGSSTELLARHIGAAFDVESFQADLAVLSGLDRYETITWRFVKNAAGENGVLVAGAAQAVRPAVPDARTQPREHDVRGFPRHVHRPLSRVRRAGLRIGAAHRRHARVGSRPGVGAITGRSAARRCSSSRTPASSIARST